MNQVAQFPEFPNPFTEEAVTKKKKIVFLNVWRKYKADTPENLKKTFKADIAANYDPSLMIKDEIDQKQCTDILMDNFESINTAFKEGMAHSP